MLVAPVDYTARWYAGLLSDYRWDTGTVTYSFPSGTAYFPPDYSEDNEWNSWFPLTFLQMNEFRGVAQQVSKLTNLNLLEVNDSTTYGDIRLAFNDQIAYETAAYAYYPWPMYENGTTPSAAAGDIWLNYDTRNDNSNPGSWFYMTLIHELGHALGLSHSFEAESDFPAVPSSQDSFQYTVMSYTDHPDMPETAPVTFQLMDVAALQYMYGANTDYNSSDTLYTFTDSIPLQTLWDGGGYDTLDFSALGSAIASDIGEGGFSSAGEVSTYSNVKVPGTNNLAIAFGTFVEKLIATDYNDQVTGAQHDNAIELGLGNDTFYWKGGHDRVWGGDGEDSIQLNNHSSRWSLDTSNGLTLDKLTLYRDSSTDNAVTFSGIETVSFSDTEYTPHQLMFELEGDAVLADASIPWASDVLTGSSIVSAEEAQLYRAYLGIMGRTPDQPGFEWWQDELQKGSSLEQMTTGFYNSVEFRGRADIDGDNSISHEELLDELYTNTLGRLPDDGGYNWWLNELYYGFRTPAQAMLEFTQSDEYVDASLQVVGMQLWLT